MSDFDKKKHWENIYDTKNLDKVSWYQPTPSTSLDFIKENSTSLATKIIDIGGGESLTGYPVSVFGPGTGLGAAVLAPKSINGGFNVIATEGGHAALALWHAVLECTEVVSVAGGSGERPCGPC